MDRVLHQLSNAICWWSRVNEVPRERYRFQEYDEMRDENRRGQNEFRISCSTSIKKVADKAC